jgi:hypothetical protein
MASLIIGSKGTDFGAGISPFFKENSGSPK